MQVNFFKDSFFYKSNRKWYCGRAIDGCPCDKGPDKAGKCLTKYACEPELRGDFWLCKRSERLGGACEKGPLPSGECCIEYGYCAPVRSVNDRLDIVIKWVTALTLAFCFLVVFGTKQDEMVDPGSLSLKHTAITECSDCHALPEQRGITSMAQAITKESMGTRLTEKCISCHDIDNNYANNPHTVSPYVLEEISKEISERAETLSAIDLLMSPITGNVHVRYDILACTVCHQDHRGVDFDMSKVTLKQCNSCHYQKVRSFEKDHPEFSLYPYQRRTRIIFDHETHLQDYFQRSDLKKTSPESCTACHQVLEDRQPTLLTGYKDTCMNCHEADILDRTKEGLSVFSMPQIDLEALGASQVDFDGWPKNTEAELTPFMRILLLSDDRYRRYAQLEKEKGVVLNNLKLLSPEDLQVVKGLMDSIKDLYKDLDVLGTEVIYKRLSKLVKYEKALKGQARDTISMLPIDAFRVAREHWFSERDPSEEEGNANISIENRGLEKEEANDDLMGWLDEIPEGSISQEDDLKEDGIDQVTISEWMRRGGWFFDYDSLIYRPTGHADAFIKSWIDFLRGQNIKAEYRRESTILFEHLALGEGGSFGACAKCHSVDESESHYMIHWEKVENKDPIKSFTKYNHRPHVELVGSNNCRYCHIMKPNAKYEQSFKDFSPYTYNSNFQMISRESCVQCHNEELSKDTCQTCHNYHVEDW